MKKDLKMEKGNGGGYLIYIKERRTSFFIFTVIVSIHFFTEVSKFDGHHATLLFF